MNTVEELGLDDMAREALTKVSASQQKEVLRRVNPEVCRNPSAVVCKLVQEYRNKTMGSLSRGGMPPVNPMQMQMMQMMGGPMMQGGGLGGGMGGDPMGEMKLMDFFSRHMLDDKAGTLLSTMGPSERFIVMGLVDAHGRCKNPSAVVMSKIKLVQTDPNAAKLEFCQKAADPVCLQALNNTEPEVLHKVMSEVNPMQCGNLSAVLMSKIRKLGGNVGGPVGGSDGMEEAVAGDLESIKGLLDQRATDALDELSPEDQEKILSDIDPRICRNPSAVALSKIRRLKSD